ncbi:hypothetical protein MOQ_007805 [Trypanosoma cruzi marinkellei]|uniref:Uncharacterized protein n=1 Tax=Trypanosoma cruzi marinkellei TaxID=85056 RepID=K2MMT6_TRYCR|nr:hypothetical protein MOQ_007805 [Trypanosoma cruzi marinkellei]
MHIHTYTSTGVLSRTAMSISWKVIDFCRHFGVDVPSDSELARPATAHLIFNQLARKGGVSLNDATARLRLQNEVEGILEEEGLDDGTIALSFLRGQQTAVNPEKLRECVASFLSDRRQLAGDTTPVGKHKEGSVAQVKGRQSSPLLKGAGPDALWRGLMSIEAALFSTAVDLSRKSDEIHQRKEALEARARVMESAEADLQKNKSVQQNEMRTIEAELERQQMALLVESAKLEERRVQLTRMEEELNARSKETRLAEEAIAAERAALKTEKAKLMVVRATLEQDRKQCNEMAHSFIDRERRLKEMEKLLLQAKDDLTAYERFLTHTREKKGSGKERGGGRVSLA